MNVYRLITRDTIEERIMGLQMFKQNISNTVISHDNESLDKMGTDRLLDLFQVKNAGGQDEEDAEGGKQEKTWKDVLQKSADEWDESEYQEYDVGTFMQSLKEAR